MTDENEATAEEMFEDAAEEAIEEIVSEESVVMASENYTDEAAAAEFVDNEGAEAGVEENFEVVEEVDAEEEPTFIIDVAKENEATVEDSHTGEDTAVEFEGINDGETTSAAVLENEFFVDEGVADPEGNTEEAVADEATTTFEEVVTDTEVTTDEFVAGEATVFEPEYERNYDGEDTVMVVQENEPTVENGAAETEDTEAEEAFAEVEEEATASKDEGAVVMEEAAAAIENVPETGEWLGSIAAGELGVEEADTEEVVLEADGADHEEVGVI